MDDLNITPAPQSGEQPPEQPVQPLLSDMNGAPAPTPLETSAHPAETGQNVPPLPEMNPAAEQMGEKPIETAKKGLPKAVLIGGGLLVAGLVAAAVYFGGPVFFKAPVAESPIRYAATTGEVCPADQYYDEVTDASTGAVTFDATKCKPIPQDDCDLIQKLKADPDTYRLSAETILHVGVWAETCVAESCVENEERDALNECVCKEGYFELPATRTELTALTQETLMSSASDQTSCVNCDDLKKGMDDVQNRMDGVSQLDLSEEQKVTQTERYQKLLDSYTQLAEKNGCIEKVESCVPGENEIVDSSGQNCVCKTSYTRDESNGMCVFDCEKVGSRLSELKTTPPASITPEVQEEIKDLEALAATNQCELQVVELTACEQYAQAAKDQIASGSLMESYNAQLRLIREKCTREYSSCEQRLAVGTVARAYMTAATNQSDITYFTNQYNDEKDGFYADATCIDIADRCRRIEVGGSGTGTESQQSEESEPPSGMLTVDSLLVAPDTGAPSESLSIFSQEQMNQAVSVAIDQNGFYNDDEFYNLYCITGDTVPMTLQADETAPSDQTTPIVTAPPEPSSTELMAVLSPELLATEPVIEPAIEPTLEPEPAPEPEVSPIIILPDATVDAEVSATDEPLEPTIETDTVTLHGAASELPAGEVPADELPASEVSEVTAVEQPITAEEPVTIVAVEDAPPEITPTGP